MSVTTQTSKFVQATSAGAFYVVRSKKDDPSRRLLQQFLGSNSTPSFNRDKLASTLSLSDDATSALIHHLQKLSMLQTFEQPMMADSGKLEDILPGILKPLSCDGKALLADSQGFYLATTGFPHESAEELSALGADLASLHERHSGLLDGNLNAQSQSWGLLDAGGFSKLGFWPLNIGNVTFTLVISGMPRLDRHEFLRLVWTLYTRYAADYVASDQGAISA